MNLYPRSFLQLILLGNVLVTLPLLGAIAYTSFKLDDLARRSADAMLQASQAAALGRALPEDIDRMERNLRQYEVLHDPSLLDDYASARLDWRHDAAAYAAIPLLGRIADQLATLQESEAAAYRQLGRRGEGVVQLKNVVVDLKRRAHPLLDEAQRLAERESETFRRQAETLRQRMLWAELLAFAAAGCLLWLSRRQMERLWSRFERAVQALGEGQLERKIRLKGPEDMQMVGRRLEWLRCRLVDLEQQRTQVLRHVSHELKTPLAALREGTSLLAEGAVGPLTAPQSRIVNIMQGNVLRQQTLIDGLLRLQQAGFALQRFEATPLRLDALIQQVLETHQLVARNKRLRISGSLAPLEVEGGREELTAIVDNLISNAIKFTPEGGSIEVSVHRDGDQAALDVIDSGPGVPAADRDKIFQPFYRGKATKSAAGVGLGLAISHQFALAHRGALELLDATAGAHFRVTLPLAGSDR